MKAKGVNHRKQSLYLYKTNKQTYMSSLPVLKLIEI